MTRKSFAKQIMMLIENSDTPLEDLIDILSILEPIDKEKFAAWGKPEERSSIDECW